jgi:hypothetical protein
MIRSEERIKELYKVAEWQFSDDEFSEGKAFKPHMILLDTDLEIDFVSLSNNEFVVYVPVFRLGNDEAAELQKIKHMSALVAKLNFESSINSAISEGVFRLELLINVDRYDLSQCELLLQDFLDECDHMVAEAKNYDEAQQGLFNHVPINFLMS